MDKCDQAVVDFLAPTEVGKFRQQLAEEPGQD
jgi:hypothetical protein